MIQYLEHTDVDDGRARARIAMMPAGVEIPDGYVAHQVRRFLRWEGNGADRVSPDVDLQTGFRDGRTTGAMIELTLRRLIHPSRQSESSQSREAVWLRIAAGTVVRKALEDLGIFTGSHVLQVGPVAVEDRSSIDRLILRHARRASCAAYKVTEDADERPLRVLDPVTASRAERRLRRAGKSTRSLSGTFELLLTGVPERLLLDQRAMATLRGKLAAALFSEERVSGVEIEIVPATDDRRQRGPRRMVIRVAVDGGGRNSRRSVLSASIFCEALVQPVMAHFLLDRLGSGSISDLIKRRDVLSRPNGVESR
jgi:chorismate synthase